MTTINAGNITKGSYILFKGSPVGVTKTEFMSPGKGSPVMRIKFRNVQTGSAGEYTYKTSEQVEVAEVSKKEMQNLSEKYKVDAVPIIQVDRYVPQIAKATFLYIATKQEK